MIGYFTKKVYFCDFVFLYLFKKNWIWPPDSGTTGLQVVSGGQVKMKKNSFSKSKSSTYKTKYAFFIFKYVNNIQKDAYFVL